MRNEENHKSSTLDFVETFYNLFDSLMLKRKSADFMDSSS